MKTLALSALVLTFSLAAQAKTQTFDLVLKPGLASEICAQSITLDSSEDLAKKVVSEIVGKTSRLEMIENSKSSIVSKEYKGTVINRVFLAKQNYGGYYTFGVFTRIEIEQRGSGESRTGFVVRTQALNYLSSAEIAEGMECSDAEYVLRK